MYKVYLQNCASIGTSCGYAEAPTKEEAQQKALDRVKREYDVEGKLEGESTVIFYKSVTF